MEDPLYDSQTHTIDGGETYNHLSHLAAAGFLIRVLVGELTRTFFFVSFFFFVGEETSQSSQISRQLLVCRKLQSSDDGK